MHIPSGLAYCMSICTFVTNYVSFLVSCSSVLKEYMICDNSYSILINRAMAMLKRKFPASWGARPNPTSDVYNPLLWRWPVSINQFGDDLREEAKALAEQMQREKRSAATGKHKRGHRGGAKQSK